VNNEYGQLNKRLNNVLGDLRH
jgi:hypothetical protein